MFDSVLNKFYKHAPPQVDPNGYYAPGSEKEKKALAAREQRWAKGEAEEAFAHGRATLPIPVL